MADMLIRLICEKTKQSIPRRMASTDDPERIQNLEEILYIAYNPPSDLFELLQALTIRSTADPMMYRLLLDACENAKKGNVAAVMRSLTMYKDE